MMNRPKLIIADEPTAALDAQTSKMVIDLFCELVEVKRTTILMVTHDERIINIANRNVRLIDGCIELPKSSVLMG